MMSRYQLIVITRSGLDTKSQELLREKISSLVTKHKGNAGKISLIGRRAFAYPIGTDTEGIYFSINFEISGSAIKSLNKDLKLLDGVLRFVVRKLDDKEVRSKD